MKTHTARVYPSKKSPPRQEQLAWKIAEVAADRDVVIEPAVAEMVVNRIIDNASVAISAINRSPVASARAQALAHPRERGATVFGMPMSQRFECEWAAWANGTAVRELDMHDTFLAADYSHPGDNIPALVAVAQQCGRSGSDLLRGIITGYEIQIDLVKSICLHEHKIDHIAHLGPSVAAGLGTMLGLDIETIFQAPSEPLKSWIELIPRRSGVASSGAWSETASVSGTPSPASRSIPGTIPTVEIVTCRQPSAPSSCPAIRRTAAITLS